MFINFQCIFYVKSLNLLRLYKNNYTPFKINELFSYEFDILGLVTGRVLQISFTLEHF